MKRILSALATIILFVTATPKLVAQPADYGLTFRFRDTNNLKYLAAGSIGGAPYLLVEISAGNEVLTNPSSTWPTLKWHLLGIACYDTPAKIGGVWPYLMPYLRGSVPQPRVWFTQVPGGSGSAPFLYMQNRDVVLTDSRGWMFWNLLVDDPIFSKPGPSKWWLLLSPRFG